MSAQIAAFSGKINENSKNVRSPTPSRVEIPAKKNRLGRPRRF